MLSLCLSLQISNFISRIANQFWSDPSFISSYIEAQFRPRAARQNECVLLIPSIFNPGETIPVNIRKDQLHQFYVTLFSQLLSEEEEADQNRSNQITPTVAAQW